MARALIAFGRYAGGVVTALEEPAAAGTLAEAPHVASPWWRRCLHVLLLGSPYIAATFGLPVCPSALMLRMPCPGCGMTRAVLAALSGDVAGSLALHPLALVAAPVTILALGWVALGYIHNGTMRVPRWLVHLVIVLGVALFALWAARFMGAFGGPVSV
jgi:hypothetical protein